MAEDLRQRIAEALVSTIGQATIILGSSVADLVGRQPGDVTEYDLADAVMAVRDQALSEAAEELAASEGRGDYYRERAEKAEAANARTRERLDALIAAGFGAVTDTLRELRAALDCQEADRGSA